MVVSPHMSASLTLPPELLDAARVSPAWPFEEDRKSVV
jgi:lysyl-tRNA synthetase class 1